MPRHRSALLKGLLAGGALAAASIAMAQNYPTKPIRFFVPYAPGGVGDITARLVAQKMTESMKQAVLIENRPGAGSIPANDAALKAEPDGYAIVLSGNGNALSASLFKSLPYDIIKDFTHISTIGFFDIAMIAAPSSRFASAGDVVQYAKQNPGKLTIGTVNIGSTQNLAAELFKSMAGIDALIVPFRESSAVVTAIRSNEVQIGFEILAPVMSQFRSQALKPLAIGAAKRFPGLPATPTLQESGVAGYLASSWNGISISAKAPRPVVERLSKEVNAAVNAPDVRQRMLELGVEARGSTPEEMRALMIADIAKWKAVIERAHIERQ